MLLLQHSPSLSLWNQIIKLTVSLIEFFRINIGHIGLSVQRIWVMVVFQDVLHWLVRRNLVSALRWTFFCGFIATFLLSEPSLRLIHFWNVFLRELTQNRLRLKILLMPLRIRRVMHQRLTISAIEILLLMATYPHGIQLSIIFELIICFIALSFNWHLFDRRLYSKVLQTLSIVNSILISWWDAGICMIHPRRTIWGVDLAKLEGCVWWIIVFAMFLASLRLNWQTVFSLGARWRCVITQKLVEWFLLLKLFLQDLDFLDEHLILLLKMLNFILLFQVFNCD